ncbi:MAG: TssQ family T6SS-associated lipoprotein [Betaproteobacteria bacterium]|nr:TssQ family T6SS-associated lipoprotein [Betaproteobacteria bacterium]MDH3436292.1 TssQ family T6SS-associated lipoprotein [Betaproteobacteria bacterium]
MLFLLAWCALLAGCETTPVKHMTQDITSIFKTPKGQPELTAGIRSYEDGNYNVAMRQLQSALKAGLNTFGEIKAHKYLAFIYCSSGRESRGRDEFRKVLALDPDFNLAPAEAGHPTWGPIFRSLKAEQR